MKALFKPYLVNKPYEDPLLYIDLFGRKDAFAADLGDISKLSNKKILRISRCFVTHTHIDHFFGFDGLLRSSLGKLTPIYIYGPKGIIENVKGKLRGYSFNLIKEYPIRLVVCEIRKKLMRNCEFSAENGLKPSKISQSEIINHIIYEDPEVIVKALILNHKIPVIAYLFEERRRLNVNKDALNRLGLMPGPWLAELKNHYLNGRHHEFVTVNVNGEKKLLRVDQISRDIIITREGEKLFYLTDIRFSDTVLKKIKEFAYQPDIFFCEAFFNSQDEDRAKDRYHLTAKQTNIIAKTINAKKLVIFHFSPRYKGNFKRIYKEAMEGY